MRIELRTALRDESGNLVDPILLADQYRCTATGLPANQQIRVSFSYLNTDHPRDFTADINGNIDALVTAAPAIAVLFPSLGSVAWEENGDSFISGVAPLSVVTDGVTITVQLWP